MKNLIATSNGQLNAKLSQYELTLSLNGFQETICNEIPWIVEDWPELNWQGDYFFHRSVGTIYLVENDKRSFDGSIYRPRLRGFQEMVNWASSAPVGFTTLGDITEKWGYMLCSPWLVRSTENRWYQRVKMFTALNGFNSGKWPMSLLLSNWDKARKIMF
ncbi:MAG: hypothetical protein H8D67_14815 [Deltaproteobacteria bacterium]|nr:hypothetical protein [Deltaproteobacteria bacterium]